MRRTKPHENRATNDEVIEDKRRACLWVEMLFDLFDELRDHEIKIRC